MKNIDIRNLGKIGVSDVDVYNTNKFKLNSFKQISAYIRSKDVFIYELVSADDLIQKAKDIKKIIYSALEITDNDKRILNIDPISGWITFSNYEYLDRDRYRGVSYSEQEIDEIIHSFFKKLNDINKDYSQNNPSVPILFETTPKLAEIIPVYEDKKLPSRWIVRYNVYLDYTEHERNANVPVRDSLIEFLIDSYGAINSIFIRWRPIQRKTKSKLYFDDEIQKKQSEYLVKLLQENAIGKSDPFNLYDMACSIYIPDKEKEEHHDSDEEEITTVEYYLAGQNTVQTHLTPFIIHQNGHHSEKFEMLPSCLNISFDITSSTQETKIKAVISNLDEKGSYSYSWSAWEITNPENFVNLGSSDSCSLKGGVFHVLLTVKNSRTGQTEQHQEHVFSTLPTEQQFEVKERWDTWGCTDPTALNYNPNANCDDGSCKY
ncbi:hypothetical protein MUU74_04190 [Chryseobacterium daecheongense]|uniref:hypothetical protein n=1 Tax=Chryseobacterium daecheongense TaxID=192389 RepID=UPI001FD6DB01|nr:hypothetical protein [Chryseobacterium daecheongense]UOU99160.1 hypothetical protein MUU74_04190 [Chryseobacterium daecheongense]